MGGRESGVGGFGDLGIRDPVAGVGSQTTPGYRTGIHACSSIASIAAATAAFLVSTSENRAPARRQASPEAPVPVVDAERIWHRPGGAGLAAVLAARANHDVVLVTALGDDLDGHTLRELLTSARPD